MSDKKKHELFPWLCKLISNVSEKRDW